MIEDFLLPEMRSLDKTQLRQVNEVTLKQIIPELNRSKQAEPEVGKFKWMAKEIKKHRGMYRQIPNYDQVFGS